MHAQIGGSNVFRSANTSKIAKDVEINELTTVSSRLGTNVRHTTVFSPSKKEMLLLKRHNLYIRSAYQYTFANDGLFTAGD